MQKYKIVCLAIYLFAVAVLPAISNTLTTDQIIDKVLKENNSVKANNLIVKAAKNSVEQEKKILNPELEIGLENFGINELEIVITQPIELGGKRKQRILQSENEFSAAKYESEISNIELKTEIYRRLVPILLSNCNEAIVDSISSLINTTIDLINQRVAAGASNKIDALRAKMEIEQLNIQKMLIKRERNIKIKELASLWGEVQANNIKIEGTINHNLELLNIGVYKENLKKHPQIQLFNLENQINKINISQAKKSSVPDLALSGGYVRNNENKENAVLFGASIELPLFNRNRDEVKGLKSLKESKVHEAKEKQVELSSQIDLIHGEISSIDLQLEAIYESILPKSNEILLQVLEFYKKGAISFLDVLEAQREEIDLLVEVNELKAQRANLFIDLFELTAMDLRIFN